MLAKSRATALKYTKTPYKICVSQEPTEEIFYVPDSSLPALDMGSCDPMSLITPAELYKLKKTYRAPNSLIRKVQECYKKNSDEFDLGDNVSLESSLFITNVEETILRRLKTMYRNESANFLPYYPREELGIRCYHTLVVGSSSVGKSWVTAAIIKQNFDYAGTTVYVFSPTATKDKAWTELRKALGKRAPVRGLARQPAQQDPLAGRAHRHLSTTQPRHRHGAARAARAQAPSAHGCRPRATKSRAATGAAAAPAAGGG